MKSSLVNDIVLRIGDIFSCQVVYKLFKYYSTVQWYDRDEIIKIQEKNLSNLLNKAYKEVKMYRELYDNTGFKVNNHYTKSDLCRLPIITKDLLRKSYPKSCCRSTWWPVREMFTSGSSGQPFRVKVDNLTLSHARALMMLRATYSGWRPGIPYLQTGMSLSRGVVKKIKDVVFGVSYASAYDLTDTKLDYFLNLIEKKKLAFLMGYPASIYYLAIRAERLGFNMKMEGVVTWGDNLFNSYRKKIENVFSCRVTDTYGCGEGIQVAAQCGMNNDTYHIFSPQVIVEIVDDDGNLLPAGQRGNVLLTRLVPGAMPLIRYKIGDIGILHDRVNCPCGRGFEILEAIEGRDTDIITTPNGNRLIVHFFTGIFEYYPEVESFQITQELENQILVKIVPGQNFNMNILEDILHEIHEKGDESLSVVFEVVDSIPLTKSGKRRFVISSIGR